MVSRRVAVVKWLVTEPVSQAVDAEGGLLDEEDSEDASIDKATHPVTPAESGDEHGKSETHEENDLQVVSMLPDNNWILVEIADIGAANTLWVLLHDHPSDVRVEETFSN